MTELLDETAFTTPSSGARTEASIDTELATILSGADFDMEFPYLNDVLLIHGLIDEYGLRQSTHPLIREFLCRYPTRPANPLELNVMITANKWNVAKICA